MLSEAPAPHLIRVANLKSFFQQSVQEAATNQKVDADDATLCYLAGVLSDYARSEFLFDHTEDGLVRRPLVDIYKSALEAESLSERKLLLRRLGDIALFISGIFYDSLQRSLVDVDYYVSMGESAYGYLSGLQENNSRGRALSPVFDELSRRFVQFMDILGEVGENAQRDTEQNVYRLYQIWNKTGSERVKRKLMQSGIIPQAGWATH